MTSEPRSWDRWSARVGLRPSTKRRGRCWRSLGPRDRGGQSGHERAGLARPARMRPKPLFGASPSWGPQATGVVQQLQQLPLRKLSGEPASGRRACPSWLVDLLRPGEKVTNGLHPFPQELHRRWVALGCDVLEGALKEVEALDRLGAHTLVVGVQRPGDCSQYPAGGVVLEGVNGRCRHVSRGIESNSARRSGSSAPTGSSHTRTSAAASRTFASGWSRALTFTGWNAGSSKPNAIDLSASDWSGCRSSPATAETRSASERFINPRA